MTVPEYAYKFDLGERPYWNLSRENLKLFYGQYFEKGETHKALGFIMELLHRAPYDELYKKEALICISKIVANQFNPQLKQVLLIALTGKTSAKDRAFILWQDTFHLDPLHAPLHELIEHFEDRTAPPLLNLDVLRPALHDPFLHAGISTMILAHTPTEQALIFIRKHLLLNISEIEENDLDFLSALAIHSFYTEFMFYESDEETSAIESLISKLEQEQSPSPLELALLGCYRPLFKHVTPEQTTPEVSMMFENMIKTHITEPIVELSIRPTIQNVSDINDDVSQNVQSMYEENPYPRWYDQTPLPRVYADIETDILVAGCGTGNFTSQLALMFPNAPMKAVDLSRSSLSYAIRKAREYGAFNIDFKQGDILELKNMDQQFDLVECSGVLHHMKDPEAGWESLLHCLKPGGRMFIALYSEIAREPIVKCRELIAKMEYTSDPQGIRAFRKDVMEMEPDDPLFPITFFRDFFSLSECRDLVFHIQEKRYTLPELKDVMERLGIHFLGFRDLPDAKRRAYSRMYPDDEEQTNLLHWHEVEKQNTDFFTGMYQFVCCREGEENIHNENIQKIVETGYFPISAKKAQVTS